MPGLSEKMRKTLFGRSASVSGVLCYGLVCLAVVLLFDFVATGIHTIRESEQGVVLRFGAIHRMASPGLVVTLPWPFERLRVVNTREMRKMPVGFRFVQGADPTAGPQMESEWLTGDMNVIDVEMIVHYTISYPARYLFRIGPVDTDFLIRKCAESVLTETLGVMPVDAVLTTDKSLIERQTRECTQAALDRLGAGVFISRASLQTIAPPSEVIEAFKDVSSAKADRERAIQEADGYRKEILPQARAEAMQIEEQAKIYESRVLSGARGAADRFSSLYEEYRKAPKITRTRLLLDTLRTILRAPKKVVVTQDGDGKTSVKIIQ